MHPEIQELQTKLKEILYDCAVDIKATKAALYLYDGGERYELITQYGFRGGLRESADRNDPLVDRCGRGRTAFFVNGLGVEPRFSELLYEASTDRLLAAPVYLRGQLVGIVDMRDKAGKAPFDKDDLPKAQRIAEHIAELFAARNVFGQRFITLSEAPESAAAVSQGMPDPARTGAAVAAAADIFASTPTPQRVPAVQLPAPRLAVTPLPAAPEPQQAAKSHVPRLASLILEARAAAERFAALPQPDMLTEAEIGAVNEVLRSMLLVPSVVVASFSAFGHLGGVQQVVARSTVTDDGMTFLQSKLHVWLVKRGEVAGVLRGNVQQPFGTSMAPIGAQQMQKVFTAPVAAGSLRGLYLTVAFDTNPERVAHEMLAAFHGQLQIAIEHSMLRTASQTMRWRIGEKLLEPDFTRYPELRRHSDAVVARVDAFSRFIALSPSELETTRIVALVHDCGARLLDYDLLYRKRDISQDELGILQEHVHIGAAMVEPILGMEIARAVLCHHERFDGRGYPNQLRGEEIPRTARIIQICDAYEMMTAEDNYQSPVPHEKAMTILARGAGTQFDEELVHRFEDMMRSMGK